MIKLSFESKMRILGPYASKNGSDTVNQLNLLKE